MRHTEDKTVNTVAILICLLSVFISAGALLGLRLYASNLESRVASASKKLEAYKDENTLLERRRTDLLSPTNVYTYAQEQLGMNSVAETPVIHVDANSVDMAKAMVNSVESSGVVALDRVNPFVKKAYAKE